jgi:hypothetical protein
MATLGGDNIWNYAQVFAQTIAKESASQISVGSNGKTRS